VVANARLRRRPAGDPPVHIGIRGGRIAALGPEELAAETVLDAGGNLVTPSFVNAHLHLDKVYTSGLAGEEARRRYAGGRMEGAAAAIDLAARVKDQYDESWIYANARRALADGLKHGVTHLLAFADTDTRARLEGIKALLRLREEWKGMVEVRVVAFPQDGVVRDKGAEEYVRQALELGADLVGGIPWIEETEAGAAEHIERMLALARAYDRDVAMLTDDAGDPALRTTEMLGAAAIREDWTGRVIACHARAMALYPEPAVRRLIGLARRAEMAFVTDPHTGPLHLRAADLLAAGRPVALGQDDIADAYYPYGQHSLLEVAFLASHLLGWTTAGEMETLLDMVTTQGARVLRLSDYGLQIGRGAHLCVLNGETVPEVLTRHAPPRFVISHGRLAAETHEQTEIHEMPRR
jgi:cytosine deaminase